MRTTDRATTLGRYNMVIGYDSRVWHVTLVGDVRALCGYNTQRWGSTTNVAYIPMGSFQGKPVCKHCNQSSGKKG